METRKEYFELLSKPDLTEQEQQKILQFEEFIRTSKEYEPYISPFNQEIVANYEREISFLASLNENETNETSKQAVQRGKEISKIISFEEQKRQKREQEEQLSLKRALYEQKKAGYTNASILLFVVFNLGLFLAAILLYFKW